QGPGRTRAVDAGARASRSRTARPDAARSGRRPALRARSVRADLVADRAALRADLAKKPAVAARNRAQTRAARPRRLDPGRRGDVCPGAARVAARGAARLQSGAWQR